MALLTSLANELLDHIFSNVRSEDLINLSRTSKKFRSLVLPRIFCKVTLRWAGSPDSVSRAHFMDKELHRERRRIEHLLSALLANPRLAKHIKILEISRNRSNGLSFNVINGFNAQKLTRRLGDEGIESTGVPLELNEQQRKVLKQGIDSLRFNEQAGWSQENYAEGILETFLWMIFSSCSHLEELTIPTELLSQSIFSHQLTHVASEYGSVPHPYQLSKLRVLRLSSGSQPIDWPQEHTLKKDRLCELCGMAMLGELIMVGPLSISTEWALNTIRYLFSPLENIVCTNELYAIRLIRFQGPMSAIEMLLKQTPRLHTFVYDTVVPASAGRIDLIKLRAALEHVEASLKHLTIALAMYSDGAFDVESQIFVCGGSLGSLTGFNSLKSLQLSLVTLFGQSWDLSESSQHSLSNVLPSGLESLTITDDLWGFEVLYGTEEERTMAVFKEFFSGETLPDDWDEDLEGQDVKWVKIREPSWKAATPRLEIFTFDIRKRKGRTCKGYWEAEGPLADLRHMCEVQGIAFALYE